MQVDDPTAREFALATFGALLIYLVAPDGWTVVGDGSPYPNTETARDVAARLWLFNDQRLLAGGLTTACRGELPDARLAHCRLAAHVLARGSTIVDEMVGLRIAIRLAPDPASAEAARVALRERRWQMEQQLKLVDQDSSAFLLDSMARVTALWIETGRESEAYARLLAEQGLAITPPPGWTAPGEEHWSQ